jgi:hypothetical protein
VHTLESHQNAGYKRAFKRYLRIAVTLEVLNIVISVLGYRNQNVCPVNKLYPDLSLLFSISTLLLISIIFLRLYRERMLLAMGGCVILLIFSIVLAAVLWLTASGGLNWCNYHF